ncbi:MAG: hypothetical protein WAX69_20305, partial [Victivallales bacterium]
MSMKLAAIFSDNMVLQHGIKVPVWGWSEPGDRITVAFGSQKKSAVADKKGKWNAILNPLKISSSPKIMSVSSQISKSPNPKISKSSNLQISKSPNLQIINILVGDVWACSG